MHCCHVAYAWKCQKQRISEQLASYMYGKSIKSGYCLIRSVVICMQYPHCESLAGYSASFKVRKKEMILLGERSEPHTSESARNFLCLDIIHIYNIY